MPAGAYSQEFVIGGRAVAGVRGQSPQPPKAGGLMAKPPAARGKEVWERSPQRSAIFTIFQQK